MSAVQEVGGIEHWMQPYDVSQRWVMFAVNRLTDFADACVARNFATCAVSLGSNAPALNMTRLAYSLELK